MKYFGILLLSQAVFGLVCVVASYPEACAGTVLVSLLSCVLVVSDASSLALICLSIEIIIACLFERISDAFIFIQVCQTLVATQIILSHN